MRIEGGKWVCTWCGAMLEHVPPEARLHIELVSKAGEPTWRVVMVDGEEVHRCTSPPALPPRARQ